jgi:HEPN domain-containing protein
MKQTTKDWLTVAEDDLLAAKTLLREERLTNLVSFHCQQCLEKCFKAMIEEQDKPSIKSHDLIRLQAIVNFQLSVRESELLGIINEIYIEARYPGDLGLLPNGKPTISESEAFIHLCDTILFRIKLQLD